jgi:hypothetical protein
MKLAMAVGDSRHYVIDTILPRHFVQTAGRAGIGASVVAALVEDIRATVPGAIEKVRRSLPAGFPTEIADAIIEGFQTRLEKATCDANSPGLRAAKRPTPEAHSEREAPEIAQKVRAPEQGYPY